MTYSRIAGRIGNQIDLDVAITKNGLYTDPFAIRRIDTYRGSIRRENLISQIPIGLPSSTNYPFPVIKNDEGQFSVIYDVPEILPADDIYFDVWNYIGDDPGLTANLDDELYWITQNGSFYLFDDVWILDDNLESIRFGFSPLDKMFRRGEIRSLEVEIYPLPKYKYNWNNIIPLIPNLNPTITIHTIYNELISGFVDAPCVMGIRQGANLNSPYVIQCLIDTRILIRGTYKYFIKLNIANRTMTSDILYFTVQ